MGLSIEGNENNDQLSAILVDKCFYYLRRKLKNLLKTKMSTYLTLLDSTTKDLGTISINFKRNMDLDLSSQLWQDIQKQAQLTSYCPTCP